MSEAIKARAQEGAVAALRTIVERLHSRDSDFDATIGVLTRALTEFYRMGVEDAAARCEREAAGIRQHLGTAVVARFTADACISCATGIRALLENEKTPQAKNEAAT